MVKSATLRLDSIFHALSDSTRRSILRDVAKREKTVSQIAKPYRVSLAAISKHLKVLEAADMVTREKRGSYQIVRLNTRPMKEAGRWLAYYERFWKMRLSALQDVPDREEQSK